MVSTWRTHLARLEDVLNNWTQMLGVAYKLLATQLGGEEILKVTTCLYVIEMTGTGASAFKRFLSCKKMNTVNTRERVPLLQLSQCKMEAETSAQLAQHNRMNSLSLCSCHVPFWQAWQNGLASFCLPQQLFNFPSKCHCDENRLFLISPDIKTTSPK